MQKICVITGCCGRIGKEIVKKFYNNNHFLVLIDQDLEKLKKLVDDLRIKT